MYPFRKWASGSVSRKLKSLITAKGGRWKAPTKFFFRVKIDAVLNANPGICLSERCPLEIGSAECLDERWPRRSPPHQARLRLRCRPHSYGGKSVAVRCLRKYDPNKRHHSLRALLLPESESHQAKLLTVVIKILDHTISQVGHRQAYGLIDDIKTLRRFPLSREQAKSLKNGLPMSNAPSVKYTRSRYGNSNRILNMREMGHGGAIQEACIRRSLIKATMKNATNANSVEVEKACMVLKTAPSTRQIPANKGPMVLPTISLPPAAAFLKA